MIRHRALRAVEEERVTLQTQIEALVTPEASEARRIALFDPCYAGRRWQAAAAMAVTAERELETQITRARDLLAGSVAEDPLHEKFVNALRQVAALHQQLVERRESFERQAELLAEKNPCEQARATLAYASERASVRVSNDAGHGGSGFYVRARDLSGQERVHFVTARHVAAKPITRREAPAPPMIAMRLAPQEFRMPARPTLSGVGMAEEVSFSHTPCQQPALEDRPVSGWANDLVSALMPAHENPLGVVGPEERPSLGQEIQIGGFPGYNGQQFTAHTCTFLGYYQSFNRQGTAYALRCPSARVAISGMSGGPATGADGRVWGAVSGFEPADPTLVVIAPLSAADGELRYGIAAREVSEHCVVNLRGHRGRCTIGGGAPEALGPSASGPAAISPAPPAQRAGSQR